MPTTYKGEEGLTLDEFEQHLHVFTRESAKEIPTLLKVRQKKIDNYGLSL